MRLNAVQVKIQLKKYLCKLFKKLFFHFTEDAVNEVKKQAAAELQRAIIAAEQKATELVKREHENFEKILHESKKHTVDECVYTDDYQEDNLEVIIILNEKKERILNFKLIYLKNCWNCGRRAADTCSGCQKAKYCSQFCQQKHWEHGHFKVCNKDNSDVSDCESDENMKLVSVKPEANSKSSEFFNGRDSEKHRSVAKQPSKRNSYSATALDTSASSSSSSSTSSASPILSKLHQVNNSENITVQ